MFHLEQEQEGQKEQSTKIREKRGKNQNIRNSWIPEEFENFKST